MFRHNVILCRAMTVTQWSVTWLMSTITPGDRGGVPSRIKDISLVHFALLPSALVPLVSRKETFLSGKYLFSFSTVKFSLILLSIGHVSVTRVLILGHSFIRRLREYIGRNADLDANLHILEGIELKWHGVGGRTVLKTVQFDLSVVERFTPDIVILQLGTNDLSHLPAVNVGSAIEDLTRSLHEMCMCLPNYLSNPDSYL